MATDSLLEAHFAQQEASNHIVVRGAPRFDLEAYISAYSGRTQVDRLLHIGTHSVPLALEALKLVIQKLKQTEDVTRYRLAVSLLQKVAPEDPDAQLDQEWVDQTERRVSAETEKIEAALKSYKHNLIKESIRMGHEDMGKHYYASGDLTSAFKSYSRMRDYCTAPKHIVDMSLALIRVCIEQGNFVSVQSNIAKLKNVPLKPEEEEELRGKITATQGLAHLSGGSYREATRSFLECPPTLGTGFNEVVSPNDIAIYGGLCALASMDRTQLKSEVLDNSNFRQFLELEPYMRRAISYFHTAKYSECLQILEDYKNDYLLDIHLHRHVKRLYDSIRSKGIVQYFIPFSCVTLSAMAEAFRTNELDLEVELIGMIKKKLLEARIDTKNRLLTAKEVDLRSTVHRDSLEMAQMYERAARLRLVRMNIMRAGLDIKGPKGQGPRGDDVFGSAIRSHGYVERFSGP